MKQWKIESKAQNVSKEVFPSLLCELCEKSLTPDQCKGGFHTSGFFPLHKEAVATKLGPSQVFAPSCTQHKDEIQSITCES